MSTFFRFLFQSALQHHPEDTAQSIDRAQARISEHLGSRSGALAVVRHVHRDRLWVQKLRIEDPTKAASMRGTKQTKRDHMDVDG